MNRKQTIELAALGIKVRFDAMGDENRPFTMDDARDIAARMDVTDSEIYQRARNEALEEAAKIAKIFLRENSKIEPGAVKYILAFADAIRERMK
jgi:hypothetical protein